MQWIPVDSEGHVPGVAAKLPLGYEVLLDVCNQIAEMRPIADQQEQAGEPTQPLEQESTESK